jgi:hypothetical protein
MSSKELVMLSVVPLSRQCSRAYDHAIAFVAVEWREEARVRRCWCNSVVNGPPYTMKTTNLASFEEEGRPLFACW